MMIRNGTAVTSWNTDIASPRRPWRLCSSPCSLNWRAMMVVDDWANTAPTTKAAANGKPSAQPASVTSAVVSTTCPVPSQNTVWRRA